MTPGRSEHDDASSALARFIKAKLSEKLKDRPEAMARLIERGIVDPDFLERFDSIDLEASLQELHEQIQSRVRIEPSVLKDFRPLDFLRLEMGSKPAEKRLDQTEQTIVFSDLEGFTNFTSRRGDVEASALLGEHYDTVDAIVRSRGGHIVKKLGDGHMLAFREPAAAVMASIDLVGAGPDPLRVRAGAHSGNVVLSGSDYFGHVVNVASRVTDLADGGSALVTSVVRNGAGLLPLVSFGPERVEHLEGIDEPIEVSEARAAKAQ